MGTLLAAAAPGPTFVSSMWLSRDGLVAFGTGPNGIASNIVYRGAGDAALTDLAYAPSGGFLYQSFITTLITNGAYRPISGDGLAAAGYNETGGSPQFLTRHWTLAGGWVDVPLLGADVDGNRGTALSNDGTTIVGGTGDGKAFRYVRGTGISLIPFPHYTGSEVALDVNADGTAVCGISTHSGSPTEFAEFWSVGAGAIEIGRLPGGDASRALRISDDGSVVAGYSNKSAGSSVYWPWRWTSGGGIVDIGYAVAGGSKLGVMSADGNVLGGQNSNDDSMWVYVQGTGFAPLTAFAGWVDAYIVAISSDGDHLVGFGDDPGNDFYYWVYEISTDTLTLLPENVAVADVSSDGSVILAIDGDTNRAMLYPVNFSPA